MVFVCYAMRPLHWAVLVIAILIGLLGVMIERGPSSSYKSMIPEPSSKLTTHLRINDITRDQAVHNPRQYIHWNDGSRPWVWDKVRKDADRISLEPGPDFPLERLREMPNLRQLDLGRFSLPYYRKEQQNEDVRTICDTFDLTHFTLPSISLESATISDLSKLKNLEWLDLRGSPFEAATATLPEIPALKTLLISEVQFTADFARALKSLTNLRTIVIENAKILELNRILFDDWVKKRMHASISSDAIAQLQNLRSLKSVYVKGREFSATEETALSLLPNVSVYPLAVSDKLGLPFIVVAGQMLVFVFFMTYTAQLSRPEAVISRSYQNVHQIAFLISLLVTTAECALYLQGAANLHFLVALSICVGVTGCMAAIFLSPLGDLRFFNSGLLFFVLIQSTTLLSRSEWVLFFLRKLRFGETPTSVIVFGGFGCCAMLMLFHSTRTMHRKLAERGRSTDVFSVRDHVRELQSVGYQPSTPKSLWQRLVGPKSDNPASLPEDLLADRRTRLHCAFPFYKRFSRIPINFAVMFAILLWTPDLVRVLSQQDFNLLVGEMQIAMILTFFVWMLGWIVLNNWLVRRPGSADESCLPIDRATYTADIFYAIRKPMRFFPLLFVAAIAPFLLAKQPIDAAIVSILRQFALASSLTFLAYGAVIFGLSIRSKILVAISFFAMFPLVLFGTFWLSRFLSPAMILVTSIALGFVVGALLNWMASERWKSLEFGRLAKPV